MKQDSGCKQTSSWFLYYCDYASRFQVCHLVGHICLWPADNFIRTIIELSGLETDHLATVIFSRKNAQWPHTERPLSLCRGFQSGFLEKDNSPIKSRLSKIPPRRVLLASWMFEPPLLWDKQTGFKPDWTPLLRVKHLLERGPRFFNQSHSTKRSRCYDDSSVLRFSGQWHSCNIKENQIFNNN